MLKEQLNRCEHGTEEVNSGMMGRVKHDERGPKLPRLAKQNNDAISELYVSDVTTPSSNFFYENSVLRAGSYDRAGNVITNTAFTGVK